MMPMLLPSAQAGSPGDAPPGGAPPGGVPPADDIYDIVVLAPKESMWGTVFWIVILALVLLLFAGLVWYFLRAAARKSEEASPEEQASRRLRELAVRREEMEPNRFALSVSDALKDYLSEKFEDPVRYETTQEFLERSSKDESRLPRAARDSLREFLVSTEEIKFGNTPDAPERSEPLLDRAGMIVRLCQAEPREGRPKPPDPREETTRIPLPPE